MKDEKQNKDNMLQTKVTPEVRAKIMSLCETYGFSVFQFLRMLCDCAVRFMDDRTNQHYELERIMRMFEGLPGWKRSICLADSRQEIEIVEAFYVLAAKGKEGYRMVHVNRPMMNGDEDGWNATYNVQQILERFIEIFNPQLYKGLRLIAVEMGTGSLYDAIYWIWDIIIRQREKGEENPLIKDIKEQFGANDWVRNNRIHESTYYRRHPNQTIDGTQQKLFDND